MALYSDSASLGYPRQLVLLMPPGLLRDGLRHMLQAHGMRVHVHENGPVHPDGNGSGPGCEALVVDGALMDGAVLLLGGAPPEHTKPPRVVVLCEEHAAGLEQALKGLPGDGAVVRKDAGFQELLVALSHNGAPAPPDGEWPSAAAPAWARVLTNRELQIVREVCRCHSSRRIAAELGISVRTVDNHRANILRKLELKNTLELMYYVLQTAPAWIREPG